jgi:SAM-dependent methyltransferase
VSTSESHLEPVARYYSQALETHGTSPKGVDWGNEAAQDERLLQLLAALDQLPELSPLTLLDVGCGYGRLLDLIQSTRPQQDIRYTGFDISHAQLNAARERHPLAVWTAHWPTEPYDVVVASGTFNVKLDTPKDVWEAYVWQSLDRMYAQARHLLAFNLLSDQIDPGYERDHLYRAHPPTVLSNCLQRYGRRVALLHQYGQYDFTVWVLK